MRIIQLLCFLLLFSPSYTQGIWFSHITVNDGLRTNFTNCIAQDKKGFLWIGTENGLQRYDGNKFVTITAKNKQLRIPSGPIDQLLYDSLRNILWVRTGMQVGRFNTANGNYIAAAVPLALMPNGWTVHSLHMDAGGHIILVTARAGVFVYNVKKNLFETNNNVLPLPHNFSIINIYEDKTKGWFYLCGIEGLQVYDPHNKKFYSDAYNPFQLPELNYAKGLAYVEFAYRDKHNRFWFTSWPLHDSMRLFQVQDNKLFEKRVAADTKDYYEMNDFLEHDNLMFSYGLNLLNVYDETASVFYKFYKPDDTKNGISFSAVKQLFKDRDKNLWAVTDNGLYQALIINGDNIYHAHMPALEDAEFTNIKTLHDNYLICSSWGSGTHVLQVGKNASEISYDDSQVKDLFSGVPHDNDYHINYAAIVDSSKHQLVVTCQTGKLIYYNWLTHASAFKAPPIFTQSTITQAVKDNDNNYWFGCKSGKIIKQHNDSFTVVQDFNRAGISGLMADNKGLLWACTDGLGLQVIDIKTNKLIRHFRAGNTPSSLSSDHVYNIVQLNDSVYIICPSKNMDVLNIKTNTITHLTQDDGLPSPSVFTAVKDAKDNIWLATNDGIAKYVYTTNRFYSYGKKDGLISVINNKDILDKSCLLQNNNIIFAGKQSRFIIFNPDSIADRQIPKDVTITDIRLFNSYLMVDSVYAAGGLHLRHDQNSIIIDFTSLNYLPDTRFNYYYRLRGASADWVHADKPYSASYASLAPGTYTFEVKVFNADGAPSPHITQLNIQISKAYWQTWWFLLLMLVAAFIPVYIIYRLRINRYKAVQKIREKVARDLHDDVGSTLTSINILSEMSLLKVNEETKEVKDYLSRISNNSSQMMDAMDDIVWNIKPANDSMIKIAARMREYAATIFEPKEIEYKFINEEKVKNISLNMDVRRSLFLIFKETLNNIVKYANATLVTIQFATRNTQLYVSISDDGVGFDATTVTYGNGIENMQKRATAFKGKYVINSSPGKGTQAMLVIPLAETKYV